MTPTGPAGLAQGLVRRDIGAVVAMQFPISDGAASTFSREFYGATADGFPVDQAVTNARKALLAEFGSEWATPVLFLRSPDGVVFDPASLGTTAGGATTADPLPPGVPGLRTPPVAPGPVLPEPVGPGPGPVVTGPVVTAPAPVVTEPDVEPDADPVRAGKPITLTDQVDSPTEPEPTVVQDDDDEPGRGARAAGAC